MLSSAGFDFIYPRVVTLSRPNPTSGKGALGYQGLLPADEEVLFTGLEASIQHRGGTANPTGLPGDSMSVPVWKIILPPWSLTNGQINDRDIFTDDTGIRYQVQASYWNSLGYSCNCERLQS